MNSQNNVIVTGAICARNLLVLFTGLAAIGNSLAAPGKWSGSAEVAYASDYLWRGQKLAADSIQPAVTAVYSDNLTLGLWGSYGPKAGSGGNYSETDLFGSYSFSQKYVSFALGGTLYKIDPLVDSRNGEPFDYYFESLASITFKTMLSPTLTFWREYGRFKSNYVEFSLSHSFEINKETRFSLRPYVGAFENSNHYYGVDVSVNYEFGSDFYGRVAANLVKNNFSFGRRERVSFSAAVGRRW
jgi:hypothetical protein